MTLFTFTCEYNTTDGRLWGEELMACSWDDAISQAEFLGVFVTGVIVSVHPEDGDEPVLYNGERCPPCPVALRDHPSIR